MAAKKVVSGVFGGKGTPAQGSWDAMHSFSTRASDGFGGKVHAAGGYAGGQVSKALQAFYKTEKLNPCITSIKITVDPKEWTTSWEVTIEESPDGKAYVGFNSWGGASGGYPTKKLPASHAYSNYIKELKNVLDSNPGADPRNVIDFYFPGGFRQIFFQYTIPKKYPPLAKSANARKGSVGVKVGPSGSPAGLPEYNGVLYPCVTFEDEPPAQITASASNPDEAAANAAEKEKTDAANDAAQQNTASQGPPDPREISGKFVLKVKSGPGDIIGDTEVDIVGGEASFTGIQFNTPGDYVISVTSTSPDVDASEIKIKVNPEPEAIPQEAKGPSASEVTGTRPIIAQIDTADPNLAKSMGFSTGGSSVPDLSKVAGGVGSTIFINYNGSQINDRDITSMTLYHEGIVPKIDITFSDSNGFLAKEPPRDDTKFEIFIDSKSPTLKFIHLKFKIEDYKKLPNNQYQFFGTLDVPHLYRMKFKVYRGTSFEALRNICRDLGLGFNSNIVNTNDQMPWRNIGDKQFRFMEDIVKHSYISDTSFMAGYIDYYYCFNYVDIEKEMTRDISTDVGIETGGLKDGKPEETRVSRLALLSDASINSSCMYFIKTGEKNEATKTSIEQGTKTRTKFYDKVKKMFLVFDVDSTTTDGSKTHILKGAPGDAEAFENNYVTKYEGKIDTDNAHQNYNYAVTQNRINLDNMVKNQMEITLPNPNPNIYKYMKILATVVKGSPSPSQPEVVQWRWSGEWLISDIRYTFTNGKLEQKVTLVRKEMGKDPDEIKKGDAGGKPEEPQKNENPIVGSQSSAIAKPNEVYKAGEEYTVEDINGKKFVIKINSLSENGNEVKAEIRDIEYIVSQPVTNPESVSGMSASSAGTSGTSGTAGTSGTTASIGPSHYGYDVTFEKRQYANGTEVPQSFATIVASSHGTYYGGSYKNPAQSIDNNLSGFFISIKRPIPDFKPEKEEKNMTPFSWIVYELKDLGAGEAGTDSYKVIENSTNRKYQIIKSRLLSSTDLGISDWTVSKGYVKILDSTGKEVWSSDNDSTVDTTGDYDFILGRAGGVGDGKFDYSWFPSTARTSDQDVIPQDQLYTYVGGGNTLFIDMSNPAKFPAGTYTIEIKYNVPLYEKTNADGENKGNPYNGTGGYWTKDERLRTPKDASGYAPFEAKILKDTFTISRRSQRR